MNRDRLLVVVLAIVSLLLAVGRAPWPAARADLPQLTATQIYQPDFEEWAFLYLMAAYRDTSNAAHFVGVTEQTAGGRVRFKIEGTYSKDAAGQAWFDKVGSKIRKRVEADCRRWTAEGFPIRLNDFDIDITQAK